MSPCNGRGGPDGPRAAGQGSVGPPGPAAGPARHGEARNRRHDRHDDRGVATVWAATAVAVLIAVLAAMLDLAGATAVRHRAEAAADLAALAAAGHAQDGGEAACARATQIAASGGARVVLCRLRGWEAVVEVEMGVRLSLLGATTVRGRARAGPVAVGPSSAAQRAGTERPGR